jgi:D-sedoheptulose 7-phosphate isomerase
MIEMIMEAYRNDKKIYILGNGGGASTASHLACDLGKGTLARVYDRNEKRLHVLSLTDNVALITAYANDISYDDIFLQQLRNLVEPQDIVIAISGSGNTRNVLSAVAYSKKIGAKTIGLTGFNEGGKLAQIVDIPLIVRTNHYGPLEDVHMMIGHLVSACIASIKHSETANGRTRKNKAVPFYLD